MTNIKNKKYFILLKDFQNVKNNDYFIEKKEQTNILAGSLWYTEHHRINEDILNIFSAEGKINLYIQVKKKHLACLSFYEFKLLLAVTTSLDRLNVYNNQYNNLKLTEYIRKLSKKYPTIAIPICIHENSLQKFDGQLKFIGSINNNKNGLWLGINLNEPYIGNFFDIKSVYHNGEPLFPHQRNCGVFANIAQISYPVNIENSLKKAMHSSNNYDKINYCHESIIDSSIIKSPFLLDRFKNDIKDIVSINDEILDRHYCTVPPIKVQPQMSNIKDKSFWKFHDKDYDNIELVSDYETDHKLTFPDKNNFHFLNKKFGLLENHHKGWSSSNDIKNSNIAIDVISRDISLLNNRDLDKYKKNTYSDYLNVEELNDNSCTSSSNSMHTTSTVDNAKVGDPMLTIGERVIWFTEDGKPELATVKWIGFLDKLPAQYIAGVEFDNPIGTGTGRYENKNLFFARNNHASLIPIMGLIRANDDCLTQSNELLEPKYPFLSSDSLHIQSNVGRSKSLKNDYTEISPKSSIKSSLNSNNQSKISLEKLFSYNLGSPTQKSLIEDSFEILDISLESLMMENINFELNMLVEVVHSHKIVYGVIRWIGEIDKQKFLGIELETDCDSCTNGKYGTIKFFDCPPKRGLFAHPSLVKKDSRFQEPNYLSDGSSNQVFGNLDCVELTDNYNHLICENRDQLKQLLDDFSSKQGSSKIDISLGINLGIQGHYNSCYIDTILFSMFSFCAAFDFVLHRPPKSSSINKYVEVQTILRNSIVNPLRCNLYVKANMVLSLREIISEISSNTNFFLGKEGDPEELLNVLLIDIFKIEPFLKFSSDHFGLFYQLIVEGTDIFMPSTQKLLEMSLQQSKIKFQEVPSILMLQMPRFGLKFKVCNRILPSLTIQLQDLLTKERCIICGSQSQLQCSKCVTCFPQAKNKTIDFCNECSNRQHMHAERKSHHSDLKLKPEQLDVDLTMLHLFAVICINTSHYVCFVRCGESEMAPWVFFDSMADRIDGYNKPQVKPCQYIPECLLPNFVSSQFSLSNPDDSQLPEELRRLLCDGYICMYRCRTLQHYR